ncbi:NAD(P)H-dependent oxidoreductase [Thermanaeromonas sp. C210]|uniref:NAD(P)H-dependent oxidoreductase n=1 Tax=Thermanaeromonas sp. C210 TaxID=2731925 RepID=UPI001C279AE5
MAINDGHRKGHNTARMLEAVLQEARNLGAQTELLELSDYNIRPCHALIWAPFLAVRGTTRSIGTGRIDRDKAGGRFFRWRTLPY